MNVSFCCKFRNSVKKYKTLFTHGYNPKRFLISFKDAVTMNYLNANLKKNHPFAKVNQIIMNKTQQTFRNSTFFSLKHFSSSTKGRMSGKYSTLFYLLAAAVTTGGLSYAAVPLYRIYCQVIKSTLHLA